MSNSSSPDAPQPWDLSLARGMYHIQRWGAKYFDINDAGHVVATPLQEAGIAVDINDVIEEARGRGLKFPVLIRFQDILRHRVESINLAFRNSIAEFNYQGSYRGVFPIKVNQLREVVEEILEAGKPFNFGLEVGSKPELFAGLALQNHQGCLIICNGYKDAGFIRMALLGRKLGKKVILVVEKLEELRHIITLSKQQGVEPIIGIRARLLSKGAGKWAESGGENAKFGLSTAELLAATEMLKAENLGHCLKLLHFHIGSQVPDILTVKNAVQEAARFYAKLFKMGFAIEYIDVGGGLGMDYDGSRSAFDSSMNYTLQEYTNDIVYYIGDVCNAEKVPHPNIISESGRAIVAHHSMLVVEVFGAIEKIRALNNFEYGAMEHPLVRELLDIRKNLAKANKLEAFHDAQERKDDAHPPPRFFNRCILLGDRREHGQPARRPGRTHGRRHRDHRAQTEDQGVQVQPPHRLTPRPAGLFTGAPPGAGRSRSDTPARTEQPPGVLTGHRARARARKATRAHGLSSGVRHPETRPSTSPPTRPPKLPPPR